jgi:hypothetical protein
MLSMGNKQIRPLCERVFLRFFPTMKFQLSQLPMMVGSGRVVHPTRPFFCAGLLNSIS